jgi:arginase
VPLRTGSLFPGNENDAQAYRDARLLDRLRGAGCAAVDEGDVAIPSYLPHHAIPPIRSWPGPRIAWDVVGERVAPWLQRGEDVPLLIGCDCSLVVGTTQALRRATERDVHVLYLDGDFDDAPPDPARCQSAAAMAVWLLTRASPFWTGPPLRPTQVTVIGWSNPSQCPQAGVGSVPLAQVCRDPRAAAQRMLDEIPAATPILLHFDIDVLQEVELPAAYFPHVQGLTLAEAAELLAVLLKDPRVRLVEVSEYASLRDADRRAVGGLVELLAHGFGRA